MNINVKYCEDCGNAYDYYEYPFCREQRKKILKGDVKE